MLRLLLKFLLVYFFFSNNLIAEKINDISISGNKRISDNTILVLGNISKNDDFNNEKINNSLKELFKTNFFSDVNISILNGQLNIKVIENPIIEDIEITGVKNKSFIEEISAAIFLKERMSYTENQLQKDINLIKNILKTSGFYFADVKSSLTKNNELNSVRLKLDVNKGKKAKITEIVFIGDKKIKDKNLLEVIASEEHRFWKFISNKVYLNQNTINLDKRLLSNFYKNRGYHKVKILNSFAEMNNQESFKLIFNIEAGNQFYFNDLKVNLPVDYNKNDFVKLEEIFDELKGERYSLNEVNNILKEIDKIASSRLYNFMDAKVNETILDDNKINFTFNVIDSKKFYVERINILGNFNTIEEVLRNKFIVDEGDPLNMLLYNKSIDRIKGLGIFRKVDAKIKDGSNDNLKVIDIIVEEKPTGEISLAAGVGTSGSTIGGGITEKNFLGKGINLKSYLEISEERVKGQFIYSKPNFAYTDNTLFTSIKSTSTDNLKNNGYKSSNTGFTIGTEFMQYENLYFSPEIDLSTEDLETNSKASSQLKKQEGTYDDFYFNYGLDYDLRNSSYRPSSGNKTSFYQQLPVISKNNEVANTLIFTQYKTLNQTSEMIGKASFYIKAIKTIDNSDVRISKRAYVPYNRLRGFEKGRVGPVDGADYIGGNYVSTLNLSTNIPSILRSVENVDFKYFIDVANIWGVDYDSKIDDGSKLRSSTGLGLDFLTPIGPLSFSLSQPLTKNSTDKTETFRFNLGTTF